MVIKHKPLWELLSSFFWLPSTEAALIWSSLHCFHFHHVPTQLHCQKLLLQRGNAKCWTFIGGQVIRKELGLKGAMFSLETLYRMSYLRKETVVTLKNVHLFVIFVSSAALELWQSKLVSWLDRCQTSAALVFTFTLHVFSASKRGLLWLAIQCCEWILMNLLINKTRQSVGNKKKVFVLKAHILPWLMYQIKQVTELEVQAHCQCLNQHIQPVFSFFFNIWFQLCETVM